MNPTLLIYSLALIKDTGVNYGNSTQPFFLHTSRSDPESDHNKLWKAVGGKSMSQLHNALGFKPELQQLEKGCWKFKDSGYEVKLWTKNDVISMVMLNKV